MPLNGVFNITTPPGGAGRSAVAEGGGINLTVLDAAAPQQRWIFQQVDGASGPGSENAHTIRNVHTQTFVRPNGNGNALIFGNIPYIWRIPNPGNGVIFANVPGQDLNWAPNVNPRDAVIVNAQGGAFNIQLVPQPAP